MTHFQTARRLAPGAPEAAFGLGMAYESLGRWAYARREYEEALRLRPGYPAARQRLGEMP